MELNELKVSPEELTQTINTLLSQGIEIKDTIPLVEEGLIKIITITNDTGSIEEPIVNNIKSLQEHRLPTGLSEEFDGLGRDI